MFCSCCGELAEYENRFKELDEKMDDVQAEKVTIDSTYKQSVKLMSCFRLLHMHSDPYS